MPDSKQFKKYLIFCFGISWIIQIIASVFAWQGNVSLFRIIIAAMMFVPLLSVYLCGYPIAQLGWNPSLKGNMKTYLSAWFLPAVLTLVGAAAFFLIFPGFFDMSGQALNAQTGINAIEQLESQGISFTMYLMINLISAITYAPFINMFLAVGEEAGWRGLLYPYLKGKYGTHKGRILGGIIWGMWHWPVIALAGYEYGFNYIGFPITGMFIFCLFTITVGILCDWLYDTCHSIWAPSLCHGSINAIGGIVLLLCTPEIGSYILLGPAFHGLIGGIGLILVAAWITFKSKH